MKRILSACLEQTVIFESREEMEAYERQLEKKRVPFKVVSAEQAGDGRMDVKMKRRYVHYPVGEYLD